VTLRVMVYWSPRKASLDEQAAALWRAVQGLGRLGGALGAWRPLHPAAGQPFRSERDAREVLAARTIRWRTGDVARVSYAARLESAEALATLEVTSGIEPLGVDRAFTPNRAELVVDPRKAVLGTSHYTGMLGALVAAFTPLFGFAGGMRLPARPTAIFSDGAPPVGWLTFLSRAYPSLPPELPHPAKAFALHHGLLVMAHPEVFDEQSPAHTAAVAAVASVLGAAGVLLPHHEVVATRG
jgi:hypothetical protein